MLAAAADVAGVLSRWWVVCRVQDGVQGHGYSINHVLELRTGVRFGSSPPCGFWFWFQSGAVVLVPVGTGPGSARLAGFQWVPVGSGTRIHKFSQILLKTRNTQII